jgi:putative peptidoglycan lipid II flippase
MFFSGGHATDGVMLAQTLSILALSTPFLSANFMMSRVFYSYEDAKTPFKIQVWLGVLNVVGATLIQFLPARYIIFAIALLYTVGNILSVVLSGAYLRRRLGHLDGGTVARSYIRMGYAALGAAVVGALAVWLLGGLSREGFIWSSIYSALASIVVIGVAMLIVYLILLRLFGVTELRDLLRPIMGRLGGRGAAPSPAQTADDGGVPAEAGQEPAEPRQPVYALRETAPTLSDDTGIIPRISGQFDPSMYRARPASESNQPVPGRRTYQGPPGSNPHFPDA